MKIECTVEELKELLSNKKDTPITITPIAGTTSATIKLDGKEITKNIKPYEVTLL